MATIVHNCTPHVVHVYDTGGNKVIREFDREPEWVLRVLTKEQKDMGTFMDIPLVSAQVSDGFSEEHTKLIKQAHGQKAVLITSGYTADVILEQFPDFAGRVLTPDSSPSSVVRDSGGRILGVRAFEVHTT